jgi:DNA-directed RNA polymerase specialized sigma24 family protein
MPMQGTYPEAAGGDSMVQRGGGAGGQRYVTRDAGEQETLDDQASWAVESLERRQGDLALLAALAAVDFTGPVWARFADGLARYGHAVVMAWLRTGEMFVQCRRKSCWLSPPPSWCGEDDWVSMASDTVVKAILVFQDQGLRQGGWRPDGGASMKTYFLGTCVLTFPNVYRKWCTEQKTLRQLDLVPWPDDVACAVSSAEDPGELAMLRARLREGFNSMPDDRTRGAVLLHGYGYSNKEIADLLGTTPGAVKQILARQRDRGLRATRDGGDHD